MFRVFPHFAASVSILALVQCATVEESEPEPQKAETTELDRLREELQDILADQIRQRRSGELPGTESGERGPLAQAVRNRAEEVMAELRQRLRDDMNVAVQEMFGLPEPLREERVRLEAVDAEGNVREAPVVVQTRKLRSLTAPDVSRKTFRLLSEDGLALELYEGIPEPIEPEQSMRFLRAYTGDDAEAIAMEARLIVTLKGGEWAEPEGDKPAGNAIAVRGLDLSGVLQGAPRLARRGGPDGRPLPDRRPVPDHPPGVGSGHGDGRHHRVHLRLERVPVRAHVYDRGFEADHHRRDRTVWQPVLHAVGHHHRSGVPLVDPASALYVLFPAEDRGGDDLWCREGVVPNGRILPVPLVLLSRSRRRKQHTRRPL